MAVIAWPAGLPCMTQDGYVAEPVDNLARSAVVTGQPRVYQVQTAEFWTVAGTFVMTDAQLATLRIFYRDTLGAGAAWFDGLELNIAGSQINTSDLQFTSIYNATLISKGLHRVSVQLLAKL